MLTIISKQCLSKNTACFPSWIQPTGTQSANSGLNEERVRVKQNLWGENIEVQLQSNYTGVRAREILGAESECVRRLLALVYLYMLGIFKRWHILQRHMNYIKIFGFYFVKTEGAILQAILLGKYELVRSQIKEDKKKLSSYKKSIEWYELLMEIFKKKYY